MAQPASILRSLARLEFAELHGLPVPTKVSDVLQVFPSESEFTGTGTLGSEYDEHRYVYVIIDGFDKPGRLWLQGEDVILIDVECPASPLAVEDLTGAIGEPDLKQDSFLGTLLLENSEWIYARRGLILFINPANKVLLRIAVFAVSTSDHYLKHLRLHLRMRRAPREVL